MRLKAGVVVVAVALGLAACGTSTHTANPKATTAPSTTAGPKGGDVVSAKGTELVTPSEPGTKQIDAEAGCRTFLDTADGRCDIVMTAGGNVLWTVEAVPGSEAAGERIWRARFRVRSKAMPDGGWDLALRLPETERASGDQPRFASVTVKAADVTGDGKPEVLVGYRGAGTGQFESYDVLGLEPGGSLKVVAHRSQLHKGSVALEGTSIVDYSASTDAPECCPTSTQRTVIAFESGSFRVVEARRVPIDQQPPDLFA